MKGPLPRLRLYTDASLYRRIGWRLATGRAGQGDDVERLERTLESRLGVRHAVAVPMARTGIYLVLKSLLAPGKKVLLSPYTIADVVNMVICAGGVPVFCDIERETCNMSVAEVERLLDDETGAVLVTHFYGLMADVEGIRELCSRRGVPMLEDAAQAFGARRGTRYAGTFGLAGVFSFGMHKNVNSFLGGMVVTDDDALVEGLRAALAELPIQPALGLARRVAAALATDTVTWPPFFRVVSFRIFRWAFLNGIDSVNNRLKIDVHPRLKNSVPASYLVRLSPAQARLVQAQLDRVERDARARLRAAKLYHEGLSGLPGLLLPPLRDDYSHVYWYYPIQFENRQSLVEYAMRHGRDITMSYHRNCADLPCFAAWARPCPNARTTAESLVYLPTYPRYNEQEIRKTIAVICAYFGR